MNVRIHMNAMNEVMWLVAIKIAFFFASWAVVWNGLEFIF